MYKFLKTYDGKCWESFFKEVFSEVEGMKEKRKKSRIPLNPHQLS